MARTYTQVSPDSTGDKIAGQDIVDGADTVIRQEVLVADPTTLAGVAKVGNAAPGSTDYGLVTRAAGDGLVVLSGASVSGVATLATQDTTGYGWFQYQQAGTFNFSTVIEVSDDNSNWFQTPLFLAGNSGNLPTSAASQPGSTASAWYGFCKARYIRVRCTAFTSSTSGAVTLVLRNTPTPVEFVNVNIAATGVTQNVTGLVGLSSTALRIVPDGYNASMNFTSARIASAATTNATSVKGSAGNLYGGIISNTSASAKFVKFYNKATAPTVGTDTPIWTLALAAGATVNLSMDMNPLRFALGIAYAITGAVADSDTTAVAANDVHGFLNYA